MDGEAMAGNEYADETVDVDFVRENLTTMNYSMTPTCPSTRRARLTAGPQAFTGSDG
jgi:hypothetical protein